MKTYLWRYKENGKVLSHGLVKASNLLEMFWAIDEHLDPCVTEYCLLKSFKDGDLKWKKYPW
jgi:hypothetical protein